MTTAPSPDLDEPEFLAYVDFIGRTGAEQFQIRYSDDDEPVVWIAVAKHGEHWSTAASLHPTGATFGLAEDLADGGKCTHCGKTTGLVRPGQQAQTPLERALAQASGFSVCWAAYNPATKTVERGCLRQS